LYHCNTSTHDKAMT